MGQTYLDLPPLVSGGRIAQAGHATQHGTEAEKESSGEQETLDAESTIRLGAKGVQQ